VVCIGSCKTGNGSDYAILSVVSRANESSSLKSAPRGGFRVGLSSSLPLPLKELSLFFLESIFLTDSGLSGLLRSGESQLLVVRTGEFKNG
jgi:hypothetical protein